MGFRGIVKIGELPEGFNRVVAVDTEGSGLFVDDGARVSAISVAYRDDSGELVSEAWPFDQGTLDKPGVGTPSLFEVDSNLSQSEWVDLMCWLSRQRLIFHHAKYDVTMLAAGHRTWGWGVDFNGRVWWDTQIGQWVLEPLQSSRLKPTMQRLFGDSNDEQAVLKAWLKEDDPRYDLVPWEVLYPYSRDDAEKTYRLFEWQVGCFNEQPWLVEQFENELKVSACLTKMGYRGIGWNVEGAREEAAKCRAQIMELQRALPFRPPTPHAAAKWFYSDSGGKGRPHCVTDKGKLSVAECCVRQLINDGVRGAEKFARLQKLNHTLSNYYDGWTERCGEDGRLRTSFRQAGTVSMRFSVERVNLQAIPQNHKLELVGGVGEVKTPRELFVPKEGYELWEFDFSQAEMRIGAEIAGCKSWLKMFESGEDLHAATAIKIFGDAEYAHRQIGKRGNFALLYGVGATTFQIDLEKQTGILLSDEDAESFVEEWRALYPEFPRANKRAENVLNRDGYVTLIDGRRRYFKPFEETYKAFNSQVQGGLAQTVKRWMVALDKEGVEILLQIHDSIVCEIPVEGRDEWIELIEDKGNQLASKMFGVRMEVESKQWA